jgi:hypothetical protein
MRYSLKQRDWLKGLIMAGLVPMLYILQTSLDAGELTLNWKQIGIAAVRGMVAYLIKNFMTDDISAAKKILEAENIKEKDLKL